MRDLRDIGITRQINISPAGVVVGILSGGIVASNYWIKLYHEMLDDPKIGRLTDSQFRLMINLFLLAGDCEQDGYLPCVDDIGWRLRNPPTLKEDLDALMQYEIIAEEDGVLVICKFAERQNAMTSQERSQRRHERDRKLEYYSTKSARNPHESRTDIDKEEDIDIDKDVDKDRDTEKPQNFIQKIIQIIPHQFKNNDQPELLKDLVEDYGEEKVIEAAEWCITKRPQSMAHAISMMTTALKGWRVKEKPLTPSQVLEQMISESEKMEVTNGN